MHKQSNNIQLLDDAPSIETYQAKPVQTFGLNLLKKMGFTKQRGIGFNQENALLKPIVLKPRPKGLGLGAKPEDATEQKTQFNTKDYVLINFQPHKGMIGFVKKVKNQEQLLIIQLGISGTQIKAKFTQVEKITGSEYNQRKDTLTRNLKERNEQNNQKKKKRLKWIIPNIRCKVIDKLSPYYLKKIIVAQLLSERQFQCIFVSETGEKKYLKQFTQKQLQTIVPKVDGIALLLDTKFKGQKAKVLERNKQKGQVVVQLLETFQVQKIDEDLLSEYVSF